MHKLVSRSRCRVQLFSKYYACAMVFIDDKSSTMHSLCTGAVCNENSFGANINNKGSTSALSVLLLKHVC